MPSTKASYRQKLRELDGAYPDPVGKDGNARNSKSFDGLRAAARWGAKNKYVTP